jgi:hypothetical protein
MKPANLCRSCGLDFVSEGGFDKHRVGEHDYTYSEGLGFDPPVEDGRRCLDMRELESLGWQRDRHGRWHPGVREHALERVAL